MSVTSLVWGFWWGWPAGAWTADIPPTPASSPISAPSPMGLVRSRSSRLSLSPRPLLLTPRFHTSLCRLLAHLGLAPPLCLQSPCPCHWSCSRSCSRLGADPPSSLCSYLCLRVQSPLWNLPPLPHQLHQLAMAFQCHLGIPVQQWPPHKPSLQSHINKRKTPPAPALGPYSPS